MPADGAGAAPAVETGFDAVAVALRSAIDGVRDDVTLHETAAPKKVAPHALAIGATIERDDRDIAVGRLVILHDPEGQDAWDGVWRIACFARADLDQEMVADPVLPEVTWSWLEESLSGHEAQADVLAGTVTVTVSNRFGALHDEGGSYEVELRCSWSPRWDSNLDALPGRHVHAFAELLATMAGLPPRADDVIPLASRARR